MEPKTITPNMIFICSHILSLTGKNIAVKKLENKSYPKCHKKDRKKNTTTLIILIFFKAKIIT